MSNRKSLLVGSIPAANTEEAVGLALDELGQELIAVPDGETGSRKNWVMPIIERFGANPAVYLKKDGQSMSYRHKRIYRVRRGRRIDPGSLELGYYAAYRQSRPVVDTAAAERKMASLPFQVGVASPFDLAIISMGFVGALRHRKAFTAAAAREIAAIRAEAHDDVVVQIELPIELVLVARVPAGLRGIAAKWIGRVSTEVPRAAPAGTRFGIHLCYGDMDHRAALTGLRDCSAAVALANSIVSRWPNDVPLEYVHLPLAAGEEPPRLSASYYAPLAGLRLPSATRFVAGFVHETPTESQLRDVLRLVEAAAGRRVDIAAPCGLGRREQPIARTIMQRSRDLCALASSP